MITSEGSGGSGSGSDRALHCTAPSTVTHGPWRVRSFQGVREVRTNFAEVAKLYIYLFSSACGSAQSELDLSH